MTFTVPGTTTVNGVVKADGSSGIGGMILFTLPNGSLTVVNNGTIEARSLLGANTTGNVGFNGGENGQISVTGTGEIYGGGYVDFGNLNTSTLLVIPPLLTIYPQAGNSYSYSGLYNTNGSILINQNIDPIQVNVSAYVPPTPTPTPSSSSQTNQFLAYERYLQLLQILQTETNLHEVQIDTQIGTRIATDYVPWTSYPMQPQEYSLYGNVHVDRVDAPGQALFAASAFNANELTALSHEGIEFGPNSKNDFFDLVKGFVLFMPNSNVNVQTREGIVQIPKGAHVWVMETGADAAIYDLHDNVYTGSVKVVANNKTFTLSPGTEILLTRNSTANFESLNPGNALGYRNVRSSDLGGGIKMFVSEFSIANGVSNIPVARSLLKSPLKEQRKAGRKMLKNAAILSDLTGPDYKVE
jgi:hypothetical protein